MVAGTVPIKTPDGQAELSTRQRRVSQRHRTVLFLVDGKRSADEVCRMALQAGVPGHCFDELLAMGLIMLPEPTFSLLIDTPPDEPDVMHVDLPLPEPGSELGPDSALPDSALPTQRSMYPESVSGDSTLGRAAPPSAWLDSHAAGSGDIAFTEARVILLRALRAEAPIAGALTVLKLKRARTRADLVPLLDEVEGRITKPHRSLSATHTMRRVRQLLAGRVDSSLAPA